MRESGCLLRSARTRCIVLFLLLRGLVSPAAEAQEAETLLRFFRATPPWAVEAPGAARARFGLGLELFFERQESLRIASQEKTLRSRDIRSGREEIAFLREDPGLLNRKLDILLELEGGGPELSVPLPGLPSLGLHPSLVFQAASADVHLDFLDRTRAGDSTSYESQGSLFGTGLDVTASLCGSCPWFAGASYRFQRLPGHSVNRSPAFRPSGFEILEDETQLERDVHEISALAGYSLPSNRIASYVGVLHRSTTLEIDDELRYRDPSGTTETHISTRSRLESEATLALAGVEAHLTGPFYARIDTALGDEDRVISAKVAYLLPRKRVRIVDVWPTLGILLEQGPQINFRRNLVTGYGVMVGDWPAVVEYQLEREGFLKIILSTQERIFQEIRIPAQGNAKPGELRSERVQITADLGSDPRPVKIEIQAFSARRPRKPIDFSFYGMAVGEGAIASLAIDNVQFKRLNARPGDQADYIKIQRGDQARYSFHSRRDFNGVKILIYRYPSNPDSFPKVAWERKDPSMTPRQGANVSGPWDGRDLTTQKPSEGLHVLQINAWKGNRLEPYWVSAVSPDLVRVHP